MLAPNFLTQHSRLGNLLEVFFVFPALRALCLLARSPANKKTNPVTFSDPRCLTIKSKSVSSQDIEQGVILVGRVKTGDLDAFQKLVTKYKQPIYNYCLWMLSMNEQAAEEATKNTFDKFFDSIHRLRENHKFRAYLYRIAKTTCLREIKDRKRVDRYPSSEVHL